MLRVVETLKARHWVRWRAKKARDERATSLGDAIVKFNAGDSVWAIIGDEVESDTTVGVAEGYENVIASA